MTDRRETERAARLLDAQLLLPGLLHEVRHPLMGIQGGLQILAAQVGAGVTQSDDWKLVVDQLARLEETFKFYQEMVQGEHAETHPFEVEPVARRSSTLLASRLGKHRPRFQFTSQPSLTARGTPQSLLHAITNILSNALDAVEELSGKPRIALRVLANPDAPGTVEVRISDDGPGVPPELADKIMEPGFTTKPRGKGSGLGLHIARCALLRGGGALRLAESRDPLRLAWAKTEFIISLPAATLGPDE